MARRKSKATKILTYILLVMAIVAAIGLIIKYSDVDSFGELYVTIDGNKYDKDIGGVVVNSIEFTEISVGYDNSLSSDNGFDYRIYANPDLDYEFVLDEDKIPFAFKGLGDCTQCFDIEVSDSSLKLKSKESSILLMIKLLYPELEPEWLTDNIDYSSDFFILEVTSKDKKSTIKIGFTINIAVDSIDLDIKEIVF